MDNTIMDTLFNFIDWLKLKIRLNLTKYTPPFVQEREIWWISFGQNVGSEINGKSNKFSRPGVVIKKLARNFYLVAPTTSKERTGNWYVKIQQNNSVSYVCIHQIRTIDYRRLLAKMGQIDESDFIKIKTAFTELYK